MRPFARSISIIFIFLGVLIILGGVAFAFSGVFGQVFTPSVPSIIPDMNGLGVLAKIVGGSAIALPGLFLAAIGQVLWLLADISNQNQITNETLELILEHSNQSRK